MMAVIDDVVNEKLARWEQLTRKLDTLDHYDFYFHEGLTREEHLKYAKIGIFYLQRDIKYYKEWYDDN